MRKLLRAFDFFALRWAWLIFLLLTVNAVLDGDAVGAGIFGLLAGLRFERRFPLVNSGERVRA